MRIVYGLFVILHGLVHMLYFGHSNKRFELQEGMTWPEDAWLLSRFLPATTIRFLASSALVLAAVGFLLSGFGILLQADWWRSAVVYVSALSALTTLLFWDGRLHKLPDQGFLGLLINIAIILTQILRWP
jgi:hypothetical protein